MTKQNEFTIDDILNYFGNDEDLEYEMAQYLQELANGNYKLDLFIEELREYND